MKDAGLSDDARRYLLRIAEHIRARDTCEIIIKIQDGGVRDYKESKTIRAEDLRDLTDVA